MSWSDEETTVGGHGGEAIVERTFTLDRAGTTIPGVSWEPADGPADRVLLLGHGGTSDKRAEYLTEVAKLAVGHGMQAVAIDGPGHGERALPGLDPEERDNFEEVWRQGGDTDGIVADWQHTIDFLEAESGGRPIGWWGLSMGTMVGLPVAVAESRISVAVLGLMGHWGPNRSALVTAAPELSIPVRFILQWDDEVVPRQLCLDLFDGLGSERKTLHANPGAHSAVPVMEVVSSVAYLDRHLR